MKKKIFALLTLSVIVFGAFGYVNAQNNKAKSANQLLAILPPSDGAVTIDTKRFFGEALPQILSANQPLLTDITGEFDKIKAATGIDFRQFEHVAASVNAVKVSETQYNFEPLVLARGQYNAAGLVAVAKIVSNGKYREEKIGERTVYVFSAREFIEQHKAKITNSFVTKLLDKVLTGLSGEVALTAYDTNTLALGTPARVREFFVETKTRISGEVLDLVSRRPNAIINFGARVPNGLARFFDLDNDELGKNLDAVRFLSGSMDVADGNTAVWLSAKTVNAEQAKGLKDTLDGLQALGKALLGASKSPDKKAYGKMVENARIAQAGNEITLDLLIPQADLNVTVGAKK